MYIYNIQKSGRNHQYSLLEKQNITPSFSNKEGIIYVKFIAIAFQDLFCPIINDRLSFLNQHVRIMEVRNTRLYIFYSSFISSNRVVLKLFMCEEIYSYLPSREQTLLKYLQRALI